jgi:hypothetical protein
MTNLPDAVHALASPPESMILSGGERKRANRVRGWPIPTTTKSWPLSRYQ